MERRLSTNSPALLILFLKIATEIQRLMSTSKPIGCSVQHVTKASFQWG